MTFRDTSAGYGLPTRMVHWLMAVGIVCLYVLGLWMVELNYYSPYYRSAPDLHRSLGMLLLALLVVRFVWRLFNGKPSDEELSSFERFAATMKGYRSQSKREQLLAQVVATAAAA